LSIKTTDAHSGSEQKKLQDCTTSTAKYNADRIKQTLHATNYVKEL